MTDPIIPNDCRRVWMALGGHLDPDLHQRRDGWYSVHDLGQLVHGVNDETCARKARKLRAHGLVDWRKVPDHFSGGIFVEFRRAAVAGHGKLVDPAAPQSTLDASPTVADEPAAAEGLLFDLPDPDRASFEKAGQR